MPQAATAPDIKIITLPHVFGHLQWDQELPKVKTGFCLEDEYKLMWIPVTSSGQSSSLDLSLTGIRLCKIVCVPDKTKISADAQLTTRTR